MPLDLLHEPLISARLRGEAPQRRTLPEVLAALAADRLDDFPALRPHQEHPWFVLLVQLAAIAADRAGHPLSAPAPTEAETWRAWLSALAPEAPTAFALVAPFGEPAFLQPAVPEGAEVLKNRVEAPDELDLLVLSKNHDLKAARVLGGAPELWLYALLSLQTMDGYPGRGNYGIARMNGGLGSRALVARAPGVGWGGRFKRDLGVLRAHADVEGECGVAYDLDGPALLWLLPWDGKVSRSLEGLHPYFVEICRRVRLVDVGGQLVALKGATESARLEAKEHKGHVGDPWVPIDRAESKALTLPGAGFTYKRVSQLLAGADYLMPICAEGVEGDAVLILNALVRGQGKTEGFHERVLPVPPPRHFRDPDWVARMAAQAKARVEGVNEVRNKVLSFAIRNLLSAGEEGGGRSGTDPRTSRYLDAFERQIDTIFFPALWAWLAAGGDEAGELAATVAWQGAVYAAAKAQLDAAIDGVPMPAARRFKAIAAGERVFLHSARKHLPEHFAARSAAHTVPQQEPA
jgi:CRISPR system Cascade subunit CasA